MRVVIFVFVLLTLAQQAFAFDPEPGNRAYPIAGRDLISGEMVSLDDHLGKWVLVCFWSTW